MKKIAFVLPLLATLVLAACANGSDGNGEAVSRAGGIVTFGSWPQTIKAGDVTVDENDNKTVGIFTYCKGSDDEWYVKVKENAYKDDYKYSDGSSIAKNTANSYKWFKVEPIKWRVLTTNYNGTGKKLLFAENILTNCEFYDYEDVTRKISYKTVYPNNWEHSKVRAFLNGHSYQKKESDSAVQVACDDYLGKGFLQTAFTSVELAKITDTSVDNSARSANPDANAARWNNGENLYASNVSTIDKVFLLSEQEATKSDYGFDVCDAYKGDGTHNESARIRHTTDYAKANGAVQNTYLDGWDGFCLLRSPYYYFMSSVFWISAGGSANEIASTYRSYTGIAPALCVSN